MLELALKHFNKIISLNVNGIKKYFKIYTIFKYVFTWLYAYVCPSHWNDGGLIHICTYTVYLNMCCLWEVLSELLSSSLSLHSIHISTFPFVTVILSWGPFAKYLHTTISQLSGKYSLHIIYVLFIMRKFNAYILFIMRKFIAYIIIFKNFISYFCLVQKEWSLILGKCRYILCMGSWKVIY